MGKRVRLWLVLWVFVALVGATTAGAQTSPGS